jgi:ABC-type molybdenum transport system ATPase subunit/photorepair protein PhrA
MARKSATGNKETSEKLVQDLLQRIQLSTKRMHEGKVTYLIGNNGTGKSSILGKLAGQLEKTPPLRTVACIANSIYDKFKFKTDERGNVRYLGARNAPNAVFHAAIDRQLSRLILQAMLRDRHLLSRLSGAVKMDFSFSLGEDLKQQVQERIDLKTQRGKARSDLLTARSLAMLDRISKAGGRFESLTEPQIRVFLRYLELNIDFDLYVRLPNNLKLRFESLSTGEQNRTLLFAKILSVMEEGAVFLIDEPEISLHLHWQMGFHRTLMQLLSGLKRFHAVVATHAPIVISEAARIDPESRVNKVAVLRRKTIDGEIPGEESPGEAPVTYEFHTFAEVASHEQLVLRYFQTAPYHAREVSLELADAVLSAAENMGDQNEFKAKQLLRELRSTVGLSDEALNQIDMALNLIERGLMLSLKG